MNIKNCEVKVFAYRNRKLIASYNDSFKTIGEAIRTIISSKNIHVPNACEYEIINIDKEQVRSYRISKSGNIRRV